MITLNNLIELKKLNKSYGQGDTAYHVLHDIDLEVKMGELTAIIGESGSGKSTLINIIGFLDTDFSGEYLFKEQPIQDLKAKDLAFLRNQDVGFVFQNFKLIRGLSVYANVALPLLYAGKKRNEIEPAILAALKKVGLAGYEKALPQNMSGGQQQRVAIARAIVSHPSFLIADEPTGALDSQNSRDIMELFKKLNAEGTTILMVTHDPRIAKACKRTIEILDGRIIADSKGRVAK